MGLRMLWGWGYMGPWGCMWGWRGSLWGPGGVYWAGGGVIGVSVGLGDVYGDRGVSVGPGDHFGAEALLPGVGLWQAGPDILQGWDWGEQPQVVPDEGWAGNEGLFPLRRSC